MSPAPGRNQPCPCGSGKKYKKCCLERDETERRAQALTPIETDDLDAGDADLDVDDAADWDDDGVDADPDVVADLPPLDPAEITRICYTRGMVKSLADLRRGKGLEITEWTAPDIPAAVLDSVDTEALDELPTVMGSPDAATPVQVDIIDLQTAEETFTFQVFNRALLLMADASEEPRRIHRVCETMRRAAAGEPDALVAPPVRRKIAEQGPRRIGRGKGVCDLCGASVTFAGLLAHVETCAPAHDAKSGRDATLLQLDVVAPGLPPYWLGIEARADAKLEALDRFLRDIWLECCGHLSLFCTAAAEYCSQPADPFGLPFGLGPQRPPQRSMRVALQKALPAGREPIEYENDFGSTTTLRLRVIGTRQGRIGRTPVRLLVRNAPVAWTCAQCESPAELVCTFCLGEGEGALACRRHGRGRHGCGERDGFLPVVNSPRMGVCGYAG